MGWSVRTRWYLVAAGLLAGVILLPSGWWLWKREVTHRRLAELIGHAGKAMDAGSAADVIALVGVARPLARDKAEPTAQLDRLELQAAGRMRDFPRLLRIYDRDRKGFEEVPIGEEPAVWMVRLLHALKRPDEAGQLEGYWRERGVMKTAWFAIRVDALLAARRLDEARVLLESTQFPGKEDAARRLRLAGLSWNDPARALKWLNEAYAADPAHPDVRLFRARILERAGQLPRARVEYVAAVLAAPSNLLVRHELAEFYLRYESTADAVAAWEQAPGTARLDLLVLPGAFWRKVAVGGVPAKDVREIVGSRAKLAGWVAGLERGEYPTKESFQLAVGSTEPEEAWWLILLGLLQEGRETEALQKLESSPFRSKGLAPELARELMIALRWRLQKMAPQPGELIAADGTEASPLVKKILAWSRRKATEPSIPPPELAAVLEGDQVWSLILASFGWTAAACDLLSPEAGAGTGPEWQAYAVARSLQAVRGPERALEYLEGMKEPTPAIEVARGECLMLAGQRDRAVSVLEACSRMGGEAAFRAHWILAHLALAEGRTGDVERWVAGDPALAGSTTGRELLARAQVAMGNMESADKLFEALGDASDEGLAWRARRAFEAGNWAEAEVLTLKQLERLPDQVVLMKNLEAIRKARRGP